MVWLRTIQYSTWSIQNNPPNLHHPRDWGTSVLGERIDTKPPFFLCMFSFFFCCCLWIVGVTCPIGRLLNIEGQVTFSQCPCLLPFRITKDTQELAPTVHRVIFSFILSSLCPLTYVRRVSGISEYTLDCVTHTSFFCVITFRCCPSSSYIALGSIANPTSIRNQAATR